MMTDFSFDAEYTYKDKDGNIVNAHDSGWLWYGRNLQEAADFIRSECKRCGFTLTKLTCEWGMNINGIVCRNVPLPV